MFIELQDRVIQAEKIELTQKILDPENRVYPFQIWLNLENYHESLKYYYSSEAERDEAYNGLKTDLLSI